MDPVKKRKIILGVSIAVVIIVVGTAIGLYFYFAADTNDAAKLFEEVTVTSSQPRDHLRPGDKVIIHYKGTYEGNASFRFSSDQGKNFINIINSTEKQIEFTIPDSTFSSSCMIRVTNAVNATEFVNSRFFAVIPEFSVKGPGETDGSQVPVGNNVSLEVDSDAWSGIFSKVGNIDFNLETRLLTQKEWVSQAHTVVTDVKDKQVIWSVPADLVDQSFLVRVSTHQLALAGFPSELSYTLPFPVTAVPSTGSATRTSGSFLSLIVMDRFGAILTQGYPLQSIQVGWVTSVLVSMMKLEWGLTADGSGTWTAMEEHLYGPEGSIRLLVPSDIPLGQDVYFRITDEDDSANFAISAPMKFSIDWNIMDLAKDKSHNVIMYPKGYTFVVTVQINGFTSEYAETSNWTTTLHILDSPDITLTEPTAKLSIMVDDPSKNTYNFFYNLLTPLLTNKDAFPFTLALAFKGGEEKKAPFSFYAELPPDDGLATGDPFTGIYLFHPEIECSADLDAAACEAERLEDIPSSFTAGTSHTFIYTGSHLGFDCTPDPTCDGQAPVLWQVLYGETDAKGEFVQHDLLAGAPSALNTTMYTKRSLTITFPADMRSTNAIIRVSLPRAQDADGLAIQFDSKAFKVIPEPAEILHTGGTGTQIYNALQTEFHPHIAGDLIRGNRRFWGIHTQHTFQSRPVGGTTWDRDESQHFTVDRERGKIYYRKALADPRVEDDDEEDPREMQVQQDREAEQKAEQKAEEEAYQEEKHEELLEQQEMHHQWAEEQRLANERQAQMQDSIHSLKSKPPTMHVVGSDGHSGKFKSPAVAKVHLLDHRKQKYALSFVGTDGQKRILKYGQTFPVHLAHPLDKFPTSKAVSKDMKIVAVDSEGGEQQTSFSLV